MISALLVIICQFAYFSLVMFFLPSVRVFRSDFMPTDFVSIDPEISSFSCFGSSVFDK